MTDKQLEEYTRLKIEEATRELETQNEMFQKAIIELEKDKGIKGYRCTIINNNLFLRNPIETIIYVDDCTIGKEMKVLHDLNEKFLIKQETFENDSLFNRLKKAFKGKL